MRRIIKPLLTPNFFLILAILCSVFILAGSLYNLDLHPEIKLKIGDKIAHSVSYFVLSCFWFIGLMEHHRFQITKILWISLSILMYGIIIEVLQEFFTHNRQADFFDVVANFVGVFVALILGIVFRNKIFISKTKN